MSCVSPFVPFIDTEKPAIQRCSSDITLFTFITDPVIFQLPDPEVDDNSGSVTVYRLIDYVLVTPGDEDDPRFIVNANHRIEYQAADESGNRAQCIFYILVNSMYNLGYFLYLFNLFLFFYLSYFVCLYVTFLTCRLYPRSTFKLLFIV